MIGTFFDLAGYTTDTLNGILVYEWEKIVQNTPEDISDVFSEEKNVQIYVNQNTFNKTFEVLVVAPDGSEEELKEKAEKVKSIIETVIKEHIANRIEQGKIATKADLPTITLEELNGYISVVWEAASKEIEAEGLSSIFETQSVGWDIKLDPKRQMYYISYVEYAPIDNETRKTAERITEILKNHIEMQVLTMQTIIGEDRFFHATNEYKLNSLLDEKWDQIRQFAVGKGVDDSLFTLAGWSVKHEDQQKYYYVDFEPYGKIDDQKRKDLLKISSITAKIIKKLTK